MGCCFSKPDDDGDEVKVVQDDSTKGIGDYGSITNGTGISDETPSKKTPEKSKDDNVLKEETKSVTPVKEHARLVKSGPTTETSPLLETTPGGFKRSKPKKDPKSGTTDSPGSTASDSPRTLSTPRKYPKSMSPGSPRSTPSDSSVTSPETSPKKSSVKRMVKKKSHSSSSSDRSSSKERSNRDKTLDKSQSLIGSQSPTMPISPKPTLLDLAKEVAPFGKENVENLNSGDSGKEDLSACHHGSTDDVNKTTDLSTSPSSSSSASSDEDKTTSHYSSFDQTPICMSGDEMSPRVVKMESPPKPKRQDTSQSASSLDKKKSKTKDAMKKTKKTMKDAGKKAGKKINKIFKFGGKDTGKKSKKTDGKSESKDKGESKKPSAAKNNTLPARLSPAATKQDVTNPARRDDSTPSPDRSFGKSRMSQRMHSKYARERMEAYEAKKDAARRTPSGGFTDPRQAAHERGEKLDELGEVTESMRDGAGEFAKMAKQLRMKTEGKS